MCRRDCFKALLLTGTVALALSLVEAESGPQHLGSDVKRFLFYPDWAVHNIGNVGHKPGTSRYLGKHLPQAQVTCWLSNSNAALVGMLRARFPAVTFLTDANLDNIDNVSTPDLQAAFEGLELFLQNSGMHVTRYWQPPVGLLHVFVTTIHSAFMANRSMDFVRRMSRRFHGCCPRQRSSSVATTSR